MKKLWMIDSMNMDLVAECERFVEPGETLIGTGSKESLGADFPRRHRSSLCPCDGVAMRIIRRC